MIGKLEPVETSYGGSLLLVKNPVAYTARVKKCACVIFGI